MVCRAQIVTEEFECERSNSHEADVDGLHTQFFSSFVMLLPSSFRMFLFFRSDRESPIITWSSYQQLMTNKLHFFIGKQATGDSGISIGMNVSMKYTFFRNRIFR